MTATSTAELAICAVLVIPAIYVLFKHRKLGALGWSYLIVFCALRIVGGAMYLAGSKTAVIISNVGLSPLLLSAFGILNEARTLRSGGLNSKMDWILVLIFHVLVATGIAILAVGASSLQGADPKPSDFTMMKAGIALLTLAWVLLVSASIFTLLQHGNMSSRSSHSAGTKLLWSVVVSNVFIGIRVIYTLVEISNSGGSLTSLSGTLVTSIVLALLPEIITTIVLILGGLLTRNASIDATKDSRSAFETGEPGHEI